MNLNFKLFLFLIFIINVYCEDNIVPIVTLKTGILQGENRKFYDAFEGVPYAEKPINTLRFELPVPVKSWDGILNATKKGNDCMQRDHLTLEQKYKIHGNEDCLYLNVYTTNLKSNEKLPVIFYIHGGAFIYGNGEFFGPKFLMKTKSFVLVNINYRLGPLGFISSEDEILPGNLGLKDQTLALKWVKDNIENFGGDPNNITITGYSAGGASVHLHFMSPMSKGLFARGISHSGCALNPWVIAENSLEKAKQICEYLKCPTTSSTIMKECLMGKTAEEITETIQLFQPFLFNPFSPFGVVVEKPSEHAFITEHPVKILRDGNIQNLPWIASFTEDEGLYPGAEFVYNDTILSDIDTRWLEVAPFILDYKESVSSEDKINEISKSVKKYYLKDEQISLATYGQLIRMMTDRLFAGGIQKAVKLQSIKNSEPVYFYNYRFKAQRGIAYALSGRGDFSFGVAHGDDTILIYSTPIHDMEHPRTEEEMKMTDKLLNLYLSFSTNFPPKFGEIEMQRVQENVQDFKYLEIKNSDEASIKTTKDLANSEVWLILDETQ